MKKLMSFLVLGIAFFPLFTSAQTPESELCQTCLEENEDYYSCVFGGNIDLGLSSCDQDYINAGTACNDGMTMCEEGCASIESTEEQSACFDQCMSDFDQCDLEVTSVYDSCVAGCQSSYCGAGICSSAGGLTPGGDGSNTQGGGSQGGSSVISSNQISGMGTALVTGGSSLLRIGILLLPYAIAFTIILLIFRLIKNWSKLKNSWSNYKINRNVYSYNSFLGSRSKNQDRSRRAYRKWRRRVYNKYDPLDDEWYS